MMMMLCFLVCVEPGEGFEQVLSFDLVSVEAKLT